MICTNEKIQIVINLHDKFWHEICSHHKYVVKVISDSNDSRAKRESDERRLIVIYPTRCLQFLIPF